MKNIVFDKNVAVNSENVAVNQNRDTVNSENVAVNSENVAVNSENVAVNSENVAVKDIVNFENVADKLTERQQYILNSIQNDVSVNTKILSEQIGVNRKTIQRDVAILIGKELIKWIGSDKTGHWEIVKH